MKAISLLGKLVCIIAVITVASGILQMCCPGLVLVLVGGENGATSRQLFGTIGMFMLLFGALMLHGVLGKSPAAVLWAALQKFGAVAAVALGIYHNIFAPLAAAVAGFDLVSGLLAIIYWHQMAAVQHA